MSIYEGTYFNLSRKLLTFVGLWPYASWASKTTRRFIFEFTMILASIPHVVSCIVHYKDVDRLMLSLLAFLTLVSISLKMFGLILADKNIKQQFDDLSDNWSIINDPEEKKILVEYANVGKLIIRFYSSSMLIFGFAISLLPIIPKIMDIIVPLKSPRPNIYLMQGEYFVDRSDYFFPIFLIDVITTMSVAITTVVADVCYIAVVQQACALYSIVSRRLLALRPIGTDIASGSVVEQSSSYDWLIQTMQFHRTALKFTSVVNQSYSMSFLFILMVNIVLIPLDACAMLANISDPISFGPYAVYLVALVLHLFIIFSVGQRIVNHGEILSVSVYSNEWYTVPIRTRRLLMIFMIRCSKLPVLTAGGLLLINFETYSMIMRTAVSYITVLASFR